MSEEPKTEWNLHLPPQTWRWSFSPDFKDMVVCLTGKPPNRFHRFMLRWCLGIHSELIPQEPQ